MQPAGYRQTRNYPNTFDPNHCELERDPAKLECYVANLENAFGSRVQVIGILEIGSYAKGEAVSSSDIDTRVYVTSPDVYLFNAFGEPAPPRYDEFVRDYGRLPRQDYTWADFNEPAAEQISNALSCQVELGFVDQRYAAFELAHLDRHPSLEHALLFQSNILHDPAGFLQGKRRQLRDAIFESLCAFYRERLHDRLSRRLPAFLKPNPWDAYKLDKGGQIQWVQQAVRCLRDAVALKTYALSGEFVYQKQDVLAFCRQYLPDDLAFVQTLYEWKTDPEVRTDMVEAFRQDKHPWFKRFEAQMPRLKAVIEKVESTSLTGNRTS